MSRFVKIISGLAMACSVILSAASADAESVNISGITVYFDGIREGRAGWAAGVAAASGILHLEDFNSLPLEPGAPGSDGWGAGPGSFAGGDVEYAYSDVSGDAVAVGSGGSQTGIISSGEFDGSKAFEFRLDDDVSDTVIPGFPSLGIPPIVYKGEGVESVNFSFTTSVFAFGAEFHGSTTHDGLRIKINGREINLHDFYPDGSLVDGDGFLGFIHLAGIDNFSFVTDDQNDTARFEEFEIDQFEYATTVPIPEPSSVVLFGLCMIGFAENVKRLNH